MSVLQAKITDTKADKPIVSKTGPQTPQQIEITFNPNLSKLLQKRDCKKIAFAQVGRYVVDGKVLSPTEYRGEFGGSGLKPFATNGGYFLDGADESPVSPDYQQADNPKLSAETKKTYGQLGFKIGKKVQAAILKDIPETGGPVQNDAWKEMKMEFESFAFCEESGAFLEGIQWEFRKPHDDTYGAIKTTSGDLTKPSDAFLAAFQKFCDVRGYKPGSK
jgi:hypothetical protein